MTTFPNQLRGCRRQARQLEAVGVLIFLHIRCRQKNKNKKKKCDICKPCEPVWKVSFRDDKKVVLCKCGNQTCTEIILLRPATEEMRRGFRGYHFVLV